MKRKAAPISEVIKNVFARMEDEKIFLKEDVDNFWKALVGEQGAKHSRPTTLKKGALTVLVDSSAWLQELVMKKRQLLKGLKRDLGKDRISEIHFKIGEF